MPVDHPAIEKRERLKGSLSYSSKNSSFTDELQRLHQFLLEDHPFIERIGIIDYDADTDELITFFDSNTRERPINHYRFKLSESESLKEIAEQNCGRLIQDLDELAMIQRTHTQKIREAGFRSSYTLPMKYQETLYGFIFFNSYSKNVFSEEVTYRLEFLADMITLMVANDRNMHQLLLATLKSTLAFSGCHDSETRAHQDRVAHYSRLIGMQIADGYQLDDEFIEQLFLFAPLHDVGKISIPDGILMKPGRLTDEEFEIMKTHADKGADLIREMMSYFDMHELRQVKMLENIVRFHHESFDGNGYPLGLAGQDIPIEARIVAVADVFDALTSQRRYKEAWDNETAFAELNKLAGRHLDPDCVVALHACKREVQELQQIFK
ncbi:HD-GYP domain-containing protein [Thiomicrorhabdus sp. 6S3-12]|uniref:HD-GYP domain-containing protein n=1 Tax=Thiomicrorhabdus sp. 6S3-12 TaxID=2819681 RepID=UPI001AAD12DE|nr:HD-GYP domain-containing protein [Thiomicrorhabdus sp. 6S3-12]MBO1924799.1 HD-GYP domain-containing protein [Thiomicrorhabdus sp. 6S3-12]